MRKERISIIFKIFTDLYQIVQEIFHTENYLQRTVIIILVMLKVIHSVIPSLAMTGMCRAMTGTCRYSSLSTSLPLHTVYTAQLLMQQPVFWRHGYSFHQRPLAFLSHFHIFCITEFICFLVICVLLQLLNVPLDCSKIPSFPVISCSLHNWLLDSWKCDVYNLVLDIRAGILCTYM